MACSHAADPRNEDHGKGGETVEARRERTIRDLMRHASGLTYGMSGGTPVDQLYIDNNIEDPAASTAGAAPPAPTSGSRPGRS